MKKLGYIFLIMFPLVMVSCGLFQQSPPDVTTIDSTNFYQVLDSNKYRELKPEACHDSDFMAKKTLYVVTRFKASNLDSTNMSNLSIKLMITHSPLIESVIMNSNDSIITIIHHKSCLSNYELMETLVIAQLPHKPHTTKVTVHNSVYKNMTYISVSELASVFKFLIFSPPLFISKLSLNPSLFLNESNSSFVITSVSIILLHTGFDSLLFIVLPP
jgi:hypothetical protein